MAERFTKKQGQYLAFIYNYSVMFGQSPVEADLQRFFGTSPPTIHQMLVTLAEKQLISRTPGQARSIRLLVTRKRFPALSDRRPGKGRPQPSGDRSARSLLQLVRALLDGSPLPALAAEPGHMTVG